jgi:hypothetical protein
MYCSKGIKEITNMKNSRSKLSRVERADYFDKKASEMLKVISESDNTPEENTAHYANLSIIFLREIMMNTAIIADHINKLNTLEYPNIEKGEFNE